VAEDGQTYTLDQVVKVTAYEYLEDSDGAYYEELTLSENGTPDTPDDPENPDNPSDPENPTSNTVTFDADVDQGNAGTDSNNAAAYQVTKDGITLDVSSGILGTYNNEKHYRIYKNQTLTLTSTVGNITKIEFTCTASGNDKYGPGCFTVDGGEYDYSGSIGTWTGKKATVTFTASSNQVRATQIVVTVAKDTTITGVDNLSTSTQEARKVLYDGQLLIHRNGKTYTIMGQEL
jgi:hypothetical protein